MKKLKIGIVTAFIGFCLFIASTPFKTYQGDKYPKLKVSTIINAPACQVFEYLGNSKNANDWSVFVDHITPIKGNDGDLHSFRRCFRDLSEQEETWDEEIIIVEPCKRRRLSIFNFKNFPIEANGLLTEQLYEDLGQGKSKLTFTLFFTEEAHYTWPLLKMHAASFYIKNIFEDNLENIKTLNESEKS